MSIFEFKVTVAGLDFDDIDQLDALYPADFVLVPSQIDGLSTVAVEIAADSGERAFKVLADHLSAAAPNVKIIRVDDDLVNVPTIAQRLGVTRQAAGRWVTSALFPSYRSVVGNQKVWTWAAVFAWAEATDHLPDDEPRPLDEACVTWINGQLVPMPKKSLTPWEAMTVEGDAVRNLDRVVHWVGAGVWTQRAVMVQGSAPRPLAAEFAARSGEDWTFVNGSLALVGDQRVA